MDTIKLKNKNGVVDTYSLSFYKQLLKSGNTLGLEPVDPKDVPQSLYEVVQPLGELKKAAEPVNQDVQPNKRKPKTQEDGIN